MTIYEKVIRFDYCGENKFLVDMKNLFDIISFNYKIELCREINCDGYFFNPINDPIGLLWRKRFSIYYYDKEGYCPDCVEFIRGKKI